MDDGQMKNSAPVPFRSLDNLRQQHNVKIVTATGPHVDANLPSSSSLGPSEAASSPESCKEAELSVSDSCDMCDTVWVGLDWVWFGWTRLGSAWFGLAPRDTKQKKRITNTAWQQQIWDSKNCEALHCGS